MKADRIFIAALLSVLLYACSFDPLVHRIDIRQGNYLSDEILENVYIGMSREEVRRLLGTPMLESPFHPQRWDYIYRYQSGKSREVYQRGLSIYFDDNDLISHIEHHQP